MRSINFLFKIDLWMVLMLCLYSCSANYKNIDKREIYKICEKINSNNYTYQYITDNSDKELKYIELIIRESSSLNNKVDTSLFATYLALSMYKHLSSKTLSNNVAINILFGNTFTIEDRINKKYFYTFKQLSAISNYCNIVDSFSTNLIHKKCQLNSKYLDSSYINLQNDSLCNKMESLFSKIYYPIFFHSYEYYTYETKLDTTTQLVIYSQTEDKNSRYNLSAQYIFDIASKKIIGIHL